MAPISSSRLAPLMSCSSSAASIWPSQVRRSCLGALVRLVLANSASLFMALGLSRDPGAKLYRSLEGAVSHRPHQVAPVLRAIGKVFHRIDRRHGGIGGGRKSYG